MAGDKGDSVFVETMAAPCPDLWLAGTLFRWDFQDMGIITAKQLHQETKAVLNQLEQGESLLISRNDRTIGRLEPLAAAEPASWPDIMAEV